MPDADIPDVDEVEEHGKVPLSKRVAQTTAGYAVILAIASLGGNNAMKESILSQQEASNQWARYQAKVIREHSFKVEANRLDLMLKERGETMPPAAREKAVALLKNYRSEAARFDREKKEEITPQARSAETERDRARKKDPYFDYAEVLLQIAIIMASVAILAQARKVFYFSLVVAALGILLTINGFGDFIEIPFIGEG